MAKGEVKRKVRPANGNDRTKFLCTSFAANEMETTIEFGENGQYKNDELLKIQGFEQNNGALTLKAVNNDVVKISGNDVGAVKGKEKRERRKGDNVLSVTLVDIDQIERTMVRANTEKDDMEK